MNWKLNKIQYPIYNLGPGKRIGIWVQGCDLGCGGCVNQMLWSPKGGQSVGVLDVFNWLLTLSDNFDGITISGGEPFQQYEQLITFLHLVKKRTQLTIYCFSGYYLSELDSMFPDKLFYRYIDFLIDGRYVSNLHEDQNTKGSTNQTVYKFVDGIAIKKKMLPTNKWSVQIGRDNQIYMAGIPKKRDLASISLKLADVGIKKTFK